MMDNVVGEQKIDFLMRLPLFEGLPTAARAPLGNICMEYEFERGAIIAHQGDVVHQLYIVRAGQLEAFRSQQGAEFVRTATYAAGDWFDDYWLIEQGLHPATVRARRPGRLITISSAAFQNFVKTYPIVLNNMYPHLSLLAQDAIAHSRLQAYLRSGVRRRVGAVDSITAAPRTAGETTAEEEQFETFVPNTEQVRRYAKFQLLPDEVVYFESRRSKKVLFFQLAIVGMATAAFFLFPALLLATFGLGWNMALLGGGVLALVPAFLGLMIYINWRNCYFFVTNKRLIRRENILFRFQNNVEKVDIDNVQSVATEKEGFIANWLNIGTAAITTAAQTRVLYFDFIDNPQAVESAIKRISEAKQSIGQSQHRAALRRSVERYFAVPTPVTPVGGGATAASRPRGRGGLAQWVRETFGRVERGDAIIYHKHPIALVRPIMWPTLILVVLLLILVLFYYLTPALLALPIVWGTMLILCLFDVAWLGWVFEDWRNDIFMITDQYIFDIDRLPLGLSESRKQAELTKIENVRAEQSGLFPNVFKYGDVHVETAGADSNIVFENVKEPDKIQNEIFARRQLLITRLARQEEERKQKDYAMLIDLYYQGVQQGRIPGHRPLPELEEGGEEEEEREEPPLVL